MSVPGVSNSSHLATKSVSIPDRKNVRLAVQLYTLSHDL